MDESPKKEKNGLTVNQETLDVLVTNVIPTTKYFEVRFDDLVDKFDYKFEHLQYQIDELKENQNSMRSDMDKRFEQVDKRFEQVDKRFEQVDKRFEQVDKRFEQVDKRLGSVEKSIDKLNMDLSLKIENLAKSQEVTMRDYIIERDRLYDKKFTFMRNFNLAVITLVAGILLKLANVIN